MSEHNRELVGFLLQCSTRSLERVELRGLEEAANLRREVIELLDRVVEKTVRAQLASLIRVYGAEMVCGALGELPTKHERELSTKFPVTNPLAKKRRREGRGIGVVGHRAEGKPARIQTRLGRLDSVAPVSSAAGIVAERIFGMWLARAARRRTG